MAILTQGPTPLDGFASVRLSGDVVRELEALLGALEGDEPAAAGCGPAQAGI